MAVDAASRLRDVRLLLQEIAKQAPQASASIKKVTESLDAMGSRAAPKNIGMAFPTFTEVKQLADGFNKLDSTLAGTGTHLQAMTRHARNFLNEISQIQTQMARAGVSLTPQILLPARAGVGGQHADLRAAAAAQLGISVEELDRRESAAAAGIQEPSTRAPAVPPSYAAGMFGAGERGGEMQPAQIRMTGDVAAFNAEMLTSENITKAGGVALEALKQKYSALGLEVRDARAEISASDKTLEAHATLVKKVGNEYVAVAKDRMKVSMETFKPVETVALGAGMEKQLGTQKFAQFKQQLDKLGFSMANLKSHTIEGVNQISRFTFATKGSDGAVKSATFNFDRFGRSLGNMSNRFKSFDQAIAANITKVLRWGIATAVVWGAMRQLNEAFRQLIITESQLADLSITTGESMDKMGFYFNKVAAVARETGTDIADAMKGINIAMRVGEGATQAEQMASSFDFLGDAAAYAKLSNLDMAKASDVLIASLKQMGMSITDGDVLLNKWVATSRATNVSMVDLGQAFATTAASADAAGVSIDELNAYIGVFALVTNKSAQESANALRAMFSAIQTPSAQKALEGYGIAVKTASGELRDMPAILEDINILLNIFGTETERGENALSKMAYVLGGQGARRQADFVSFLKEYNKTRELTNVSEGASGELEEAMAKKTATLQTAILELKSAFTELAQALGAEGGALPAITKIVELLTDAIDFFRDLTKAVGPATTAIIAFGAAWAISKQMALGPRIGEALGGLGAGGGAGWAGAGMPVGAFGGAAGKAAGGVGQAISMTGPGLAMAGMHIAQGISGSMEWEEVGVRSGASIAGAFVGNMLLPGFGGLIGAFIGEAFAGKAMEEIKAKEEAFEIPVAELDLQRLERARETLQEQLKQPDILVSPMGMLGVTPLATDLLEEKQDTRREAAATRLKEIEVEISRLRGEGDGVEEPTKMPAYAQRYMQYQQYLGDLETKFAERRKELPLEFAAGDIGSAREYAASLERMEQLTNSMLPIFDAMVASIRAQGGSVGNLNDRFVEMGTTMAAWSDESLSFIQTEALAIKQLETDIDSMTAAIEEHGDALDHMEQHAIDMMGVERDAAQEALDARLEGFDAIYEAQAKQERIRAYGPIPGFQDYGEYTQTEFDDMVQRAGELQAEFAESLGIPDEVMESIEEWAALAGDSFQWVEGVLQQFVSMAKSEYEDLQAAQDEAFNIRRLKDVDPSKMGEIAAGNRYWMEYLAQLKGMTGQQYMEKEGEEFNLILGEGNELQQIYSTAEAMQFTLQDILETEKKQLEGMWNIPSGATWFVPITSLFAQEKGAVGFPELDALVPPTEQTAEATKGTKVAAEKTATGINSLISLWNKVAGVTGMGPSPLEPLNIELLDRFDAALREAGKPGFELPEVTIPKTLVAMLGTAERMAPPEEEVEAARKIKPEYDWSQEHEDWRLRQYKDVTAGKVLQKQMPMDVNVTIPPIDGTFNIQNVVTLDGRVIYQMISKIVARTLTDTIRKSGKSNSKPGR